MYSPALLSSQQSFPPLPVLEEPPTPRDLRITLCIRRRPESRPSGRRRAVDRLSFATSFTARGGQRPQAATRQERVICRQIRRLPPRQARLQRLDRSIATVVKNLRTQVWQQAPGVHHVLAIMSAELLEQLRFLGWNHDVSNGDGRDYGQSPNQPVRCNQSCRNE